MAKTFDEIDPNRDEAVEIAAKSRADGEAMIIRNPDAANRADPSQLAFDAVFQRYAEPKTAPKPAKAKSKPVKVDGKRIGKLGRSGTSLRIDILQGDFADWLEDQSDTLLQDLHDRWKSGGRKTEQ